MTFDELVAQITPEQVRALWAAYGLGVCVGELWELGRTEDEIRIAFEQTIKELKKKRGQA
jgi:hypothetical protein